MSKKIEKHNEYAVKVMGCLSQLFDEESDYYIDSDELEENMTELIHAIANIAPTQFYNKITDGDTQDQLGFNHIANRLIYQFTEQAD